MGVEWSEGHVTKLLERGTRIRAVSDCLPDDKEILESK